MEIFGFKWVLNKKSTCQTLPSIEREILLFFSEPSSIIITGKMGDVETSFRNSTMLGVENIFFIVSQ